MALGEQLEVLTVRFKQWIAANGIQHSGIYSFPCCLQYVYTYSSKYIRSDYIFLVYVESHQNES